MNQGCKYDKTHFLCNKSGGKKFTVVHRPSIHVRDAYVVTLPPSFVSFRANSRLLPVGRRLVASLHRTLARVLAVLLRFSGILYLLTLLSPLYLWQTCNFLCLKHLDQMLIKTHMEEVTMFTTCARTVIRGALYKISRFETSPR